MTMSARKKKKPKIIRRLGLVGVVSDLSEETRSSIQDLLDQYAGIVLSSTDMPPAVPETRLTGITVRASTDELGAFTGKLGLVQGVRVKSLLW